MTDQILTADEVKRHNTRKSVWMVIRNDVYDVTAFVDEHPGGEDPLLEAAGQDATIAFEDVGHSEDAKLLLKKYKIGTLAPGEGCSPYHHECVECNASSRKKSFKSNYKAPASPKTERRIQNIVVPRERRGKPCRPPPPPPPPEPRRGSRLKWALLALGAAIIIGLAYKKYAAA